jgi:bla regulator protein BlaR1
MKTILALFLLTMAFPLWSQENKKSDNTKETFNSLHKKNQNQALIIIDGIKFSHKDTVIVLDSINPDNIESIEVVKGESAILQYGEEGKDGVIIVTTKSPIRKEPLYIVKEPLYIVDGIKTKSITDLDPNDIESINVLKGKDNTSQYGDEGEAGVVLITKKKKQNKN